MADVQPLRALHYDPAVVGPLADVVAPPYDVIDAEQRAQLLARSPYNVVAIDLPQRRARPLRGGRRAVCRAGSARARSCATSSPALWAHTQDYTGPDGQRRTRRGFFCRVRIEEYGAGRVRPHERTHPGPEGGPPAPDARDAREPLADLLAVLRPAQAPPGGALEPATAAPPWGEVTDADGTVHRLWRVGRRQAIAAVQEATRDAELLIADGHHRYETTRAYAEEVGGERRAPLHPDVPGRARGSRA